MNKWIFDNLPLILAGLLVLTIAVWWLLVARRRTRVRVDRRDALEEGAAPAARNQALIDAAPVVPETLGAAGVAVAIAAKGAHAGDAGGDDLLRIKGLGPKLAATLHDLGVTRVEQIAAWNADDVARIDPQLGRFQGRIDRDRWIEQAQLLVAGDEKEFNARFGASGTDRIAKG